MSRSILPLGTILTLNSDDGEKHFQIDNLLGDGANCIAYAAHEVGKKTVSYTCRIKECYPYRADISRNGLELKWNDPAEREASFSRMRKAHEVIVELRNSEEVGNNITNAMLCEGNGTLYSVMEVNHASTFDQWQDLSLYHVLETLRILTDIVGSLHKKGFLHLDIKPENFLVSYRPSTNIWLFDVDSLVSIEDLRSGKILACSYSPDWAAPEQLRGLMGKYCPATDLYTIGSILFQRIMGRPVNNADTGLFAEWTITGELLEKVNPKIKRNLESIFRKTLAASVKRRFQSAEELSSALQQACEIARDGKPFVLSNCPAVSVDVLGRHVEMDKITQAFRSGSHAVFLHGEAGIGKSTLAIAYGNQVRLGYDTAVFLRYRESLKDTLHQINLYNYEDTDHSGKGPTINDIRLLVDEHVLLIIDNYDVSVDDTDYLEELLSLPAKLLFTTRTDFSDVLNGDISQIEVNRLPENDLITLIVGPAQTSYHEKNRPKLQRLLKLIGYNTYAAELSGYQLKSADWSIGTLLCKIEKGFDILKKAPKVRTMKDGRIIRNTIPEIFRVLYNMASLSDSEKQVLRNLYVLRFIEIDISAYIEINWGHREGLDELNLLVETGWIQTNGKHFFLHPIVEDLVASELQPCEQNCEAVFCFFDSCLCEALNSYTSYDDEVETYYYENHLRLALAFYSGLECSNPGNRSIVLQALNKIVENIPNEKNEFFVYPDDPNVERILNCISQLIAEEDLSANEIIDFRFIQFGLWAGTYRILYLDENRDLKNQLRDDMLLSTFDLLKASLDSLPQPERDTVEIRIYSFLWRYVTSYSTITMPKDFILQRYQERPDLFTELNVSTVFKEKHGLPMTDEEKQISDKFFSELVDASKKHKAPTPTQEEQQIRAYIKMIWNSKERFSAIRGVCDDSSLSKTQKIQIVHRFVEGLTNSIRLFNEYYASFSSPITFSQEELHELHNILDIESFLLEEMMESNEDSIDNLDEFLWDNIINRIVVQAAIGDKKTLNDELDSFFDSIRRNTYRFFKYSTWDRTIIRFYIPGPYVSKVRYGLQNIGKADLIVPYLKDYCSMIEQYWDKNHETNKDNSSFKSLLLVVYRAVIDAAECAIAAGTASAEDLRAMAAIKQEYQKKTDYIADVTIHTKG